MLDMAWLLRLVIWTVSGGIQAIVILQLWRLVNEL